MKKILLILTGILAGASVFGQQVPFTESYFLDKYSLSSAYAGNAANKSLFASYRRDWSGLGGGPSTFRLNYNDGFKSKAGLGGKIIFDKAGIFQQFFGMATYTYRVEFIQSHFLFFGLSAGMYRNTLNFSDYYNDPNFTADPSLINKDVKSKVKFISDYSMVYSFKGLEAGVMFTNVSFGDAHYTEVDVKYTPLANYQVHLGYDYSYQETWNIKPLLIFRGGTDIKTQVELAAQVAFRKKVWGTLLHRGKGVWGFGIGASVYKGVVFNYDYNLSSSVSVGAFQNHETTLGVNLGEFMKKE